SWPRFPGWCECVDRHNGRRRALAQHGIDHRGDRGAVGVSIMRAAIFDLFGADSCVSGDYIAVRKPHDECWIVGAAIGIDEEARKPRQNCRSAETTREIAGDPGRANIVGDVTVELFSCQTERAIGFWKRVGRVIAKEQDTRRTVSIDSFDWLV